MSWRQLIEIRDEARQMADAEVVRGPIACPHDGEPLRAGPDGLLYCIFDGYRPGN